MTIFPTGYTDKGSADSTDKVWASDGVTNFNLSVDEIGNEIFTDRSTTNLSEGTNLYYTDARVSANSTVVALGTGKENVSNKSTNTSLGTSDILYPTQNAVKTYVDNIPSGASASTQSTVTYGETISAGDALREGDSTPISQQINQSTFNSTDAFTDSGGFVGTTFKPEGITGTTTEIPSVILFRTDTPGSASTPRVTATIWDSPSKITNLGSVTSTVSPPENAEYTYTFASAINVTAGTEYFLEFEFDQMGSSSADFGWRQNTTSVYADGVLYKNGVEQTGKDLYFKINQTIIPESDGKMYFTDASDSGKINILGFAGESGVLDDVKPINTAGVDSNQTGLTIGTNYYLSDTPGKISSTPGTNSKYIGKAISSTEISIKIDGNNNLDGTASSTATTGAVVLGNAEGYITIKVNGVDKKIPYYGV